MFSMTLTGYDLIGVIGTMLIVVAYFGTQRRWFSATDWRFPMLNLVGAMLILVSLWVDWNFPSFVMEVFWLAISLYGLARSWRILS